MPHAITVMTVTFLLSSYIVRDVNCDRSDATDSDEDNALKQALLLVDILKSEYAKLSEQNNGLRVGSNTIAELSTCPTTKPTNATTSLCRVKSMSTLTVDSYNHGYQGSVDLTTIFDSQTSPAYAPPKAALENLVNYWSPPPFYRPNARNYRRYLPRYYRNMPFDYYYYGLDKFRRFDYEDQFGAHPNETGPTSVMTQTRKETTTSIVTAVRPRETKINKSTIISMLSQSTRTETITNKKPKIDTHVSEEIQKQNFMRPVSHEDTSTTVDHVISQVASELIHEFGSGHSSLPPKHMNTVNSYNKKIKLRTTGDWWHKAAKTTLRIYLSGSTRFPIPYPDNHAFCYTNPENALCRTMI